MNRLNELSLEFPGYFTNARGCGLFCAFDLPSGIERDKLITKMLDKNMIMLGSGDQSIRFRPHLNVSVNEIELALDIIYTCIKDMMN